MIAQELEVSLHMAFMDARQKKHEFITVEHLLLAMLENASALEVLKACGTNLEELKKLLVDFIEEHTPLIADDDSETQPTAGNSSRTVVRKKRSDWSERFSCDIWGKRLTRSLLFA